MPAIPNGYNLPARVSVLPSYPFSNIAVHFNININHTTKWKKLQILRLKDKL